MTGVDTSILVRYFTQDDAVQGAAARRFVQHELSVRNRGHVSLVALAELAWVLRSRYKAARDDVIAAVEALMVAPSMVVQDEHAVWLALEECAQSPVGVADALIAAVNRVHGCTHTVTFDAQATRIRDMRLLSLKP